MQLNVSFKKHQSIRMKKLPVFKLSMINKNYYLNDEFDDKLQSFINKINKFRKHSVYNY